jgi:L,D-transpeptidase ErfK/SrfK
MNIRELQRNRFTENVGRTGRRTWISAVLLSLSLCVPMAGMFRIPDAKAEDVSLEALRVRVASLEAEIAGLKEQNKGIRHMLRALENEDMYIVVDTENNRLTLRQGDKVLLSAVVGTGSREYVEEETGRNWYFESPVGSLSVLGKERNPVWIRPDWSYVEENMPVPEPNDPNRVVRDVLGKYALILGNGYKIHGTKYTELLGTHFTHGCISIGDTDLERLYKTVKIGTRVYIY